MNKQTEKTIVDAPNYKINENGVITNKITELPITENLGAVRLTVDGKRKSFKVATLMEDYFPLKKENQPAPGKEVMKDLKAKEKAQQEKDQAKTDRLVEKETIKAKEKKEKTPKVKKEKVVKEKSRSQLIFELCKTGHDAKAIFEKHPDWNKAHIYNAVRAYDKKQAEEDNKVGDAN